MFERRSLKFPITLAVAMIVIIVALIVGWILMGLNSPTYWPLLAVGSLMFALVLVGVVIYLILTIKAINLTRRQSNFIDSVTHELKSPIASLKLYLQTMSMRRVSETERQQFQKFMMEDVERLDGLISHLLDAGNIDTRRRGKQSNLIELAELIRGVGETVCLRYRVPPETITFDLKPCQVNAERVDAVMIFRNLIDNAVKYAGTPAQVSVSMRSTAGNAVVEISDNGEGIPKGLRQKVFGRFVRLGEELQRKKPGTGLGLYIVRTLVRRLGGKVKVLDRDRKSGTVFEVRLPLADSPQKLTNSHPSNPKAADPAVEV